LIFCRRAFQVRSSASGDASYNIASIAEIVFQEITLDFVKQIRCDELQTLFVPPVIE
jgi:hypothetical protein